MRQKSLNKSVKITITTTNQVREALAHLVQVGLHGNSVPEAAERLICEGLRNDLKRKRQMLIDPKPVTPDKP